MWAPPRDAVRGAARQSGEVDFRITAEEQDVLFLIAGHLDEGDAPTVDELSREARTDVRSVVVSLRGKGWIDLRDFEGRETVVALSPMAVRALSNLRYGRREQT